MDDVRQRLLFQPDGSGWGPGTPDLKGTIGNCAASQQASPAAGADVVGSSSFSIQAKGPAPAADAAEPAADCKAPEVSVRAAPPAGAAGGSSSPGGRTAPHSGRPPPAQRQHRSAAGGSAELEGAALQPRDGGADRGSVKDATRPPSAQRQRSAAADNGTGRLVEGSAQQPRAEGAGRGSGGQPRPASAQQAVQQRGSPATKAEAGAAAEGLARSRSTARQGAGCAGVLAPSACGGSICTWCPCLTFGPCSLAMLPYVLQARLCLTQQGHAAYPCISACRKSLLLQDAASCALACLKRFLALRER